MRPVKVRIRGYRRLADVECNVAPRLLAFVGRNEAGKSSLLKALSWITEDGETELETRDRARANRIDSGWVAGVHYALDTADQQAISEHSLASTPSRFAVWKQANGGVTFSFSDKTGRDATKFEQARNQIQGLLAHQVLPLDEAVESGENARTLAERCVEWLATPDRDWTPDDTESLGELLKWIDAPTGESDDDEDDAGDVSPQMTASIADTKVALTIVKSEIEERDPVKSALKALWERVPKFVDFTDKYRELPTHTAFDDSGQLTSLAPSIANLLGIAGIDVGVIERARTEEDVGEIETLTQKGNEALKAFFGRSWNQSGIAVQFRVKESTLECLISESETGRATNMEERSDGLRAFIALAAFIETQHLGVPPVLLIDEAERHLHLDAQADLVSVLLGQLEVTQVIYTTHSPGCLPSDLGTGIRLVRRDTEREHASVLAADFWTNTGPGLSPLLYAMGAGAFAFSACRRAVLAEGASEMIMLPTLLRWATDKEELDFQVAPGLSQSRPQDEAFEDVAARVVYLVDGDEAGQKKTQELVVDASVAPARIVSWPDGMALEDLLNPEYLLRVMQEMRPADVPLPSAEELLGEGTIMARLEKWAKLQEPKVKLIGKAALAYRVIEDLAEGGTDAGSELLKPAAREVLVRAYEEIERGFERPKLPLAG